MTYALDTNTISFLLRPSRNPDVTMQFERIIAQGHDYVIPPLSYYEVYWHLLWKRARVQTQLLERLYNNSAAKISMGEEAFIAAANIKAYLMERGTPIGKNDGDIFIAAYCMVNDYTLVTDNISDFKHIEGLKFVNWKD